MTQASAAWAVTVAALATAGAGPYLARLTLTVPDRARPQWWRPVIPANRLSGPRVATVTGTGLCSGAAAGAAAGWTTALPAFLWLALVITPLVVIDIDHHRLPDRLIVAGAGGGTVLLVLAAAADGDGGAVVRAAAAAGVVYVIFLVFTLTSSLKYGDTKLAALLAGYLGWLGWPSVLYGIMAGFVLAAVIRLPMVAARRTTMSTEFAFGPALVAGAFVVAALRLT